MRIAAGSIKYGKQRWCDLLALRVACPTCNLPQYSACSAKSDVPEAKSEPVADGELSNEMTASLGVRVLSF